jgi:GNAT superfamily N-acetyltransferase
MDRALDLMAQLYAKGSGRHDRERARRGSEWLLAHPEYGGIWMIEVDGRVAGYLVLTIGYSLEFDGRFGLLDELYLEERSRGKGIGKVALAFAEQECRARGLAALRLEVDYGNGGALKLYRESGFKTHDRYFMTKWL